LPGLLGEHVPHFEMFAILKYVVIKPRILGPVARQPVLPCQAVCTPNSCSNVTTKYGVDTITQ